MVTRRPDIEVKPSLEIPVEELLKLAKPLPPPEERLIDDLTPEEGAAFLDAVNL